jgi:hypothetical protein
VGRVVGRFGGRSGRRVGGGGLGGVNAAYMHRKCSVAGDMAAQSAMLSCTIRIGIDSQLHTPLEQLMCVLRARMC